MKTLTKFKAEVIETEFREGAGHHHNIGQTHEVKTNDGRIGIFIRHMRAGPEGLIFKAGDAAVLIRTEELWRLAEQAETGLKVPTQIQVPADAGRKNPGEKE